MLTCEGGVLLKKSKIVPEGIIAVLLLLIVISNAVLEFIIGFPTFVTILLFMPFGKYPLVFNIHPSFTFSEILL